jgi:hypothetical protein
MDDLVFVSAQPDTTYFHWQVELYLYQFSKHGIKDRCYAVFGYTDKPSDYIVGLSKIYNVVWYKDERTSKKYIPSIRPHILKKFFKDRPELGKNVFYHDSDIFLVKLPKFELMADDVGYVSDTISYIGYNYIEECAGRYKKKYPMLPKNDLVTKMCKCMEISEELVKENEKNSGGAQYILKNIDYTFWENIETSCNKLFDVLKKYESSYPIEHHIQSWTTDMWCVLWEYWKLGRKTVVHPELDFSWGVSAVSEYNSKNIFHLAGVTSKESKTMFYKGAYTEKNPINEYRINNTIFDYISKTNATIEYINVLKEYVANKRLEIKNDHWKGKYIFDGKIWRSIDGNYLIFWNSKNWVVTATQYESEISPTCGGFMSYESLTEFML